jgi:hypothetical protein
MRQGTAPVRDAVVSAITEVLRAYQDSAAYSISQIDPLQSNDIYLEGLGQDHGIVKVPGESDGAYAARLFAAPALVSTKAIYDAVMAIVAPHSAEPVYIVEPEMDCGFVTDGTATYDGPFVGAATPRYPDRLYPDDAAENDGFVNTMGDPGGWRVYNYLGGRSLHVILPSLSAVDNDFSFVSDADGDEMFISDNSDASGSELDGSVISFAFVDSVTSDELYNSIAAVVDRNRAQGFRTIITVGQ